MVDVREGDEDPAVYGTGGQVGRGEDEGHLLSQSEGEGRSRSEVSTRAWKKRELEAVVEGHTGEGWYRGLSHKTGRPT